MEKWVKFRKIYVGLACLLLITGTIQAQKTDSIPAGLPATMLKTVPIHFEEINLTVEKFHRKNRSLQFGAGYIYQSLSNGGVFGAPLEKPVDGLSLRLAYRKYSGRRFESPQGGYHGPLATYRYMAFPKSVYYEQFNQPQTQKVWQQVFSLQYLWGLQRVFKEWLVVDAFAGLGARLKYVTRTDSAGMPGTDFYQHDFYGFKVEAGPNRMLLWAPSISLNIAIGVAL